jgi:hypothetical protein
MIPRLQFRLRSLFILTAAVGATIAFGGSIWHYVYEMFHDGAGGAILLPAFLLLVYLWDRRRRMSKHRPSP